MNSNPSVIFWDFDGVLINSNTVRDKGFMDVLAPFPKEQVDRLLEFHRANGGLSRYVKFRYFFEHIRGEDISEEEIQQWAEKFSVIMKKHLVNPSLLIKDSMDFVKRNYQQFAMHIVSGSDQEELCYLCQALSIAHYFKSIHGSPTPKTDLISQLISTQSYKAAECLLIGDSHNDYEAALDNNIAFAGYNNPQLQKVNSYIYQFMPS